MRAKTAVGWAGALSVGRKLRRCGVRGLAPRHAWRGGVAPGDWETASVGDRALMAQSMQALKMGAQGGSAADRPEPRARSMRLDPLEPSPRAGHSRGVRGGHQRPPRLRTGYIPHIGPAGPGSFLFRLRALVAAKATLCGWLGGNGYLCHLRRGFDGWRLERCEATDRLNDTRGMAPQRASSGHADWAGEADLPGPLGSGTRPLRSPQRPSSAATTSAFPARRARSNGVTRSAPARSRRAPLASSARTTSPRRP